MVAAPRETTDSNAVTVDGIQPVDTTPALRHMEVEVLVFPVGPTKPHHNAEPLHQLPPV